MIAYPFRLLQSRRGFAFEKPVAVAGGQSQEQPSDGVRAGELRNIAKKIY